jgi:hypothetical protein
MNVFFFFVSKYITYSLQVTIDDGSIELLSDINQFPLPAFFSFEQAMVRIMSPRSENISRHNRVRSMRNHFVSSTVK